VLRCYIVRLLRVVVAVAVAVCRLRVACRCNIQTLLPFLLPGLLPRCRLYVAAACGSAVAVVTVAGCWCVVRYARLFAPGYCVLPVTTHLPAVCSAVVWRLLYRLLRVCLYPTHTFGFLPCCLYCLLAGWLTLYAHVRSVCYAIAAVCTRDTFTGYTVVAWRYVTRTRVLQRALYTPALRRCVTAQPVLRLPFTGFAVVRSAGLRVRCCCCRLRWVMVRFCSSCPSAGSTCADYAWITVLPLRRLPASRLIAVGEGSYVAMDCRFALRYAAAARLLVR